MAFYSWIIDNKEIIKLLYALIVIIICAVITGITHRLFKLSTHQGIRYFRNAFLFYGIGSAIRYFFGLLFVENSAFYNAIIKTAFEFFFLMAGFFLVYSLFWKKIEIRNPTSSLLNVKTLLFYLMAMIIVLLDYLWNGFYFMLFSQIILFVFASIAIFRKLLGEGKQKRFFKLYSSAIFLSFISWSLNTIAAFFHWDPRIILNVYGINTIFFVLLLYTVIKVTGLKKSKN